MLQNTDFKWIKEQEEIKKCIQTGNKWLTKPLERDRKVEMLVEERDADSSVHMAVPFKELWQPWCL